MDDGDWGGMGGGYDHRIPASFLVEHALAVSETERCRCFLLYGDVADGTVEGGGAGNHYDDDGEGRGDMEDDFAIIMARQTRKERMMGEGAGRSYQLMSVILAEETKVMPEDKGSNHSSENVTPTSPPPSSSSPLDLLETSIDRSHDDEMGRLLASLDGRGKQTPDGDTDGGDKKLTKMERHPLGMFGLVSGVWLGDAFVREAIPPSLSRARALRDNRRRGFDKKNADAYPAVD